MTSQDYEGGGPSFPDQGSVQPLSRGTSPEVSWPYFCGKTQAKSSPPALTKFVGRWDLSFGKGQGPSSDPPYERWVQERNTIKRISSKGKRERVKKSPVVEGMIKDEKDEEDYGGRSPGKTQEAESSRPWERIGGKKELPKETCNEKDSFSGGEEAYKVWEGNPGLGDGHISHFAGEVLGKRGPTPS